MALTLASSVLGCLPASQPRRAAEVAPPSLIAALDPARGEFAEGLTLDRSGHHAYCATAAGRILRISLTDGTRSEVGRLPDPPANRSVFVLGLAFDSRENLYIAVASTGSYRRGVYRLTRGSDRASLFASTDMVWPSGVAVDADDCLFVADASGKILKVSTEGRVSTWFKQVEFTAPDDASACTTGHRIGANGLLVQSDALIFSNTDRASLVKVARNPDGSAGAASFIVAPNCATFRGVDGITSGSAGVIYVVSNQQGAVLAVSPGGTVTTVASGALFDAFPSSLEYSATNRSLFVINAAFGDKKEPRLVKVPLGD